MLTNGQPLTSQTVNLPAAPEELEHVHDALGRLWTGLEGLLDEWPTSLWQQQFEIAVIEVATNVIKHAYGAHNSGPMEICLSAYPDRFEALLIDEGTPWEEDHRESQTAPTPLDMIPESGYGLALAHATVDEVQYERTTTGHNHWHLIKRLPGPGR